MYKYYTIKDNYKKDKELLDFCVNNSKSVILNHIHKGFISQEELNGAIDVALEKNYERYQANMESSWNITKKELDFYGVKSIEELQQDFAEQYEDLCSQVREYENCPELNEDVFELNLEGYDVIDTYVTIGSRTTFPNLYDVVEFRISQKLLEAFENDIMKDPIRINGEAFEDPTFVNQNNEEWITICAHEDFCCVLTEDENYEKFDSIARKSLLVD